MLVLVIDNMRMKHIRGVNSEVLEEGVSLGTGAVHILDVAKHLIKGSILLQAIGGTLLPHTGPTTVHLNQHGCSWGGEWGSDGEPLPQ